ncbi:MAG TPA: PEP-CTERM sorting domain-containing protein [Pyrinomonadaceae bacterium]|nr:PEP-CTERM sorting domain-containing protein [Pyrinomonadaceae bacterium]
MFLLTLTVSPARADSFQADDTIAKVKNLEGHHLSLPDQSRAEMALGIPNIFENNNGKHLGFSMSTTTRGNKFGLFRQQGPVTTGGGLSSGGDLSEDTIPNPEPAAVFLLGTGLAAAGAFARKRFRKSSH